MAFSFDEVNDYIALTDSPALNLPDGDWTLAFWMKVPDLTGSDFQYILSWGAEGFTNLTLKLGEASSGSSGVLELIVNAGVNNFTATTATGVITTGTWLHIRIGRTGDTVKIYVDNVEKATDTNASASNTNVSATFYIGVREDLDSTTYFGGELAEMSMQKVFLLTDQGAALANGYAYSVFPDPASWYLPMIREYQDLIRPLTVTNNGTTVSEHPPIIYPSSQLVFSAADTSQTLLPPLFSELTIFNSTVTSTYTLLPSLFSQLTIFSPIVIGPQTLSPSLFSELTFFSPTATTGPVIISPSLFSELTLFNPTVTSSYTLSPSLFNELTFFSPTVTSNYTLSPGLFSELTIFNSTIIVDPVILTPPIFSGLTIYRPKFNTLMYVTPRSEPNDFRHVR